MCALDLRYGRCSSWFGSLVKVHTQISWNMAVASGTLQRDDSMRGEKAGVVLILLDVIEIMDI